MALSHNCSSTPSSQRSIARNRIEKSRCVARRWPAGVPVTGGPVQVNANGAVSRNEAQFPLVGLLRAPMLLGDKGSVTVELGRRNTGGRS